MLKYCVMLSLVLGGVLAWSSGCQSEPKQKAPAAAVEVKAEVTPRLNASTYYAHGHLLERQANYAGALDQYQRALELSPKMTSARNRLGITLNKLGRHADASAQFRLAIQQNPTDAHLQNNLGFSLYLEGRNSDALAALSTALELQPDYGRAHMNKGIVHAKTGDYAEALKEFALTAGEADAHYNLGVIQSELGDYAAAAHSLESALAVNPRFEAARQQLHVVARLAAGVAPSPNETLTVVAADEDDTTMLPGPAPAQELVADTHAPEREAVVADGNLEAEETQPSAVRAESGARDKHERRPLAGHTARHRRPARPTGPASSAGQGQKATAADLQAQNDLKADIIRRVLMAKLGK